MTLTKAKERATSAGRCRRVSVSVQRYSVQYIGYNLIGVTTVEGGTTRGMTALVYWQLRSSLYTDAVQGWWSTPNWSYRRQGCTQVSTTSLFRLDGKLQGHPVICGHFLDPLIGAPDCQLLTVEISLNLKVPNPHTYWVIYSSTRTTIGYTLYGPTVNGVLWWIYMICGKVPIDGLWVNSLWMDCIWSSWGWALCRLHVDGLWVSYLYFRWAVVTTYRWTVCLIPVKYCDLGMNVSGLCKD